MKKTVMGFLVALGIAIPLARLTRPAPTVDDICDHPGCPLRLCGPCGHVPPGSGG
jgi:hypothetical protein